MRNFWAHEPALVDRIASRKKFLLLFDFDGTLAPLASSPDKARLPRAIRSNLLKLRADPGAHVAVVSGRSLQNLKSYVGLKSIFYAGNHGLEIAGPGFSFTHPRAASLRPVIRAVHKNLKKEFPRLPGVMVENKGLTLSLHYRGVPKAHLSSFQKGVRLFQKKTRSLPVRWSVGHKVWEIKPRVNWDKGRAALCLIRHLKRPFPVALGDDGTDEDMFRAVDKRGISIRVGRHRSSRADYYLGGQAEVFRFLSRLHRLRFIWNRTSENHTIAPQLGA